MRPKKNEAEDLIWVEDLRKDLVRPGYKEPISRNAARSLVNKVTRDRTMIGSGPGAKAYIPKWVADKVREYFRMKHGMPLIK